MDQGSRPMFDVDIDCGSCGTKITQLPFEPSGDRPVLCMDCLQKRRSDAPRERKMFDVDLSCAGCNTHISQLPFQPKGTGDIYCFECNKNRRS